MALPIPLLQQAIATTVTNREWTQYRDDVDAWFTQITLDIHAVDPNVQIEQPPVIYMTANPTTNTGRLGCMAQTQAWMYRIHQQELNALHTANVAQQVAAAVAAAAAQAPLVQPQQPQQQPQQPQQQPQQPQQQLQQPQQPQPVWVGGPPAGPPPQFYHALLQQRGGRVKAALPKPFTGDRQKTNVFMRSCENYFILNRMTEEEQVRFALQLIEGDAEYWKETAFADLDNPMPPLWADDWDLFRAHFKQRFRDRQEQERAEHTLATGKLVQVTSASDFIDKVRDTCQKAGWNNPAQWRGIVRVGLKKEITAALAGCMPRQWDQFVDAVIDADEDLQRACNEEKKAAKKTTSYSSTSTSTSKDPARPNLSKYKLNNDERKEHVDGGLCFKCHKKGHGSKECKSKRTVYKEFKAKKAQVANVETKAETTAKIEEVSEEKDFAESD